MALTILHGDNTIQSRQKLVELIDAAKERQQNVVRLTAKTLTEAELENELGATDLFGQAKLVIIEELHSLPTSARKKALISQVASTDTEVILWEKRALTKTMLKQFPSATEQEFKTSKTLFKWLEMLGDTSSEKKKLELLHAAIESDGEYFCFLMLIRQLRQLIEVKSGGKVAGAPFMQAKIASQASNFTLAQLRSHYKQLLDIDYAQKTSTSPLSLAQQLDLLTIKL